MQISKANIHLKQALSNARKLLHFLSKKKDKLGPLLILTHDYPDPDAIASAFALHFLAERVYGIEARMAYGGIVGRTENREMIRLLKIPIRKIKKSQIRKYTNIALLDTQPEFENNSFPKNKRASIVIDQHASVGQSDAVFSLIDTKCGATSVLLAQALLQAKIDIPQRVATALVYGILSDTLDLYRAKRPDVVQTYSEIIQHCDHKALAHIQNPTHSKKFFVTLGHGIQNAVICKGVVVTHLGVVPNPDLIAQVAEFLMTYENARWSLCTGHFNGKLHVSLRSSLPNVQAGEILRDSLENRSDAGGHGTVAGGSFKIGNRASEHVWKKAEADLVSRFLKRLRISAKSYLYRPFANGKT
jgi:nanoRNase/pAp phosphatase (c-di-AMP/oligoRNAs hydrolase)